jgi:hypothetical protein
MGDQPHWLARTIEVYSVKSEQFVIEHRLPVVGIASLQQLWGRPSSDPMFDMFEVTEAQRPFLESLLELRFDFRSHSYFLSAHTTDWNAMRRDGGFMGMFAAPRELPAFPNLRRVKPKTRNPSNRKR